MKVSTSSYRSFYDLQNFTQPIHQLLQNFNMVQNEDYFSKLKEMIEYANSKNLINWNEIENSGAIYRSILTTMYQNIENYKNMKKEKNPKTELITIKKRSGELSEEAMNKLSLNPKDSYKYFLWESYRRIENEQEEIEEINKKKEEEKRLNNNINNKDQINGSEYLMKYLKDNKAFNNNIYQTIENEYKKNNNPFDNNGLGINYLGGNNRYQQTYSFSMINPQSTGYYNNTVPISTTQQSEYEKLYDAIWRKDINTIIHLTNTVNNSKPLLIGCVDSFGFTPLTLALYIGDMKLVSVILEICLKQYTPLKKVDEKNKKGSGYKINNFDLINGNVFNSIGINNNNKQIVDQHQDLNKIISLLSPIKFISFNNLIPTLDKSIKIIDEIDNNNNYIRSYLERYTLPANAVQCAMLYLNNNDFIKFIDIIKDYGRKALIKENTPENEIEKNIKITNFNSSNNIYYNQKNCLMDIAIYKGVDMIKYLLQYHGSGYTLFCIYIYIFIY